MQVSKKYEKKISDVVNNVWKKSTSKPVVPTTGVANGDTMEKRV
jgi:hypothetical protein